MLHRIASESHGEAIAHALDLIPPAIRQRIEGARLVTGVDPVFAGVHGYHTTSDGRSYRDTACALYPWHQLHRPADDRCPTVVLPDSVFDGAEIHTIVHEHGHILHWTLGLEHRATPITPYARTNHHEAFAEAFTAWVCPDYCYTDGTQVVDVLQRKSPATVHLLNALT